MAINIKNIEESKRQLIIEDYKKGKSMRQIEKDYGVTRQSVANFLEQIGVKNTKGNHYRKYYHNFDYFENINTEEKAYWLGFMYADGYILDNSKRHGQDQFGITLSIVDKDHLLKFKKSIEATNPINYDNSKKIGKPQAKIVMTSQKTVNDLIKQGCYKKKTLILEPPKNIPKELLWHFIRGFFDGDGSLTYYKIQNKYDTYGINITTIYSIANWLQEITDYGTLIKDKRNDYTWYFNLGGNRQVLSFCNKMYENASIYLDRKYKRYLELKKKYNEN